MTDFLKLAGERYSVRSFTGEAVPEETVRKILEAGRLAPTACNRQPQRILAVRSPEGLAHLRKCTECHFNAPLALIVCYDTNECWKRSYDGHFSGEADACIVATHMMLEAASLGVGSTWVMYFIPEAVKTEFELPGELEPAAILVMGFPAPGCVPSAMHGSRKPAEETVRFV